MFNSKNKDQNKRKPLSNRGRLTYSYSSVSNRQSEKPKAKTIKLKFQYLSRWALFLGLLFVLAYFISASANPIIRISDDEVLINNYDTYSQSAETIIKSQVLNRTKITFDYVEFEKKIKEQHPEIKTVSTSFAIFGGRPVVRLSFHKPSLLVASKGKTWVVDARGVAISAYTSGMSDLPKVTDEIGIAIEVGDTLISSSDVIFINKIENTARAKGIVVENYTTPNSPKQVNVKVAGEGYITKFNLNEDPAVQIGTWLVARDNLTKTNQVPTEYLDIRALEKVYWK